MGRILTVAFAGVETEQGKTWKRVEGELNREAERVYTDDVERERLEWSRLWFGRSLRAGR